MVKGINSGFERYPMFSCRWRYVRWASNNRCEILRPPWSDQLGTYWILSLWNRVVSGRVGSSRLGLAVDIKWSGRSMSSVDIGLRADHCQPSISEIRVHQGQIDIKQSGRSSSAANIVSRIRWDQHRPSMVSIRVDQCQPSMFNSRVHQGRFNIE